ncbi:MAG TPA: HAD family hydrolase, partial [Thermoplasmatales archaeon]|nr:HAD family hydrolase [Thermoplasmatales archaeon]
MAFHPDALLFDMDGVLVDSFDAWLAAMNASLRQFHLPELSEKEFQEQYWGHDLYENLQRLELEDKVGRFCVNIFGDYVGAITVFSETQRVLQQIDHYPTALVTNTPRACVDDILGHFDLDAYFDVIVTSDDVSRGKPHPGMLLQACRRLGVHPRRVLFIGDTDSDVRAGRAAGCTV